MPDPHPFTQTETQESSAADEAGSCLQHLLEEHFAALTEVKHCVFCAAAPHTLAAVLQAAHIWPEDEIITSALADPDSFPLSGASFVFADINPHTYTLDVADAEKKITKKTKAILPVHLYGYPADMNAVMHLANEHGLTVLEDAGQALLAQVDGVTVGGIGDMGLFYFPTCGNAACVTTNDDDLASLLRQHIAAHALTPAQQTALKNYLAQAEEDTEHRRKAAAFYGEDLEGVPVTLPPAPPPQGSAAYIRYVIRAERRGELQQYLHARGIVCPPCYISRVADVPETELDDDLEEPFVHARLAERELLALPLDAALTEEAVWQTSGAVRDFYEENAVV